MQSGDSGALMDSIYRTQRHFYDVTRKYYLFGRDQMIDSLNLLPGATVLEIACGTGRNLSQVARRWPGVQLHGLDISNEMLKNARRKLGADAVLAKGDATCFDPAALFGRPDFDCVILSYATSMIPDWQLALKQAALATGKHGALHVVDFGDMAGLPGPLRSLLRGWLGRFHVSPRAGLAEHAATVAMERGFSIATRRGPGGYFSAVTLEGVVSR